MQLGIAVIYPEVPSKKMTDIERAKFSRLLSRFVNQVLEQRSTLQVNMLAGDAALSFIAPLSDDPVDKTRHREVFPYFVHKM